MATPKNSRQSESIQESIQEPTALGRREFLGQATAAVSLAVTMPYIITPSKTRDEVIIGEGDYRYRVMHDCVQLPSEFKWQTTHNVAVDSSRHLYVIHEGRGELKDHPAIFVFDETGKYVRSFGSQYQGGGHGLEVRREGNEEFLYVTAYQNLKRFAKLRLNGEIVWEQRAPMESQRYAEGEDSSTTATWGRDRFLPTNISFADDGGFFLADGYGAWCVHRYDAAGKYQSTFGEAGSEAKQFNTPHGIWTDKRPGREPSLVIADRANNRLQWTTLAGEHLQTMDGFLLPANLDSFEELLLVPELQSRITLLDGQNNIVARLGDDANWRAKVLDGNNQVRAKPESWQAGKFIHPHDACFDHDGNIFVAEWVATGRISKLIRLS